MEDDLAVFWALVQRLQVSTSLWCNDLAKKSCVSGSAASLKEAAGPHVRCHAKGRQWDGLDMSMNSIEREVAKNGRYNRNCLIYTAKSVAIYVWKILVRAKAKGTPNRYFYATLLRSDHH